MMFGNAWIHDSTKYLLVLQGLLLSLALSACGGFHLRGAESPMLRPLQFGRVAITGLEPGNRFIQALQQALQVQGALLVDTQSKPDLLLNITRFMEDKTVSAYSSVRQVREFNHFIKIDFIATPTAKIVKADRASLKATVRAEQAQVYDSRYILGVAEGEHIIRKELRDEAARLLVLRLRALQ
ncbi:MAG: hypothetical protein CR991_08400 [Proteobacteria bacterium]|nr:MAG: hypothetical protein CR991_08400 [Pseudomonadota bacterium]